jgi:beta-aspartyl-peptidase (threonine type)
MHQIHNMLDVLPQVGRLEWIGLAPARLVQLVPVESATLQAGTGIDGEHHAKCGRSKRQVTLIQAEHLPVIASILKREAIDPSLLRRNLVVSGVNLIALKGRRFRIGEAILEGTGPCDPCSRMEENLGPGGYNAMRGHGGITARVVQGGLIHLGDAVAIDQGDAKERKCIAILWRTSVMRSLVSLLTVSVVLLTAREAFAGEKVVFAVHGGAGAVPKGKLPAALEKQIRATLDEALRAGEAALKKPDGTSLDAVVAAIKLLEDSPLFNAGKGAVFTREGQNELDASIMNGANRHAGAVASVTTIKNPILAARAVMEKSGHVLMVGPGADAYAKQVGLEIVDPAYFRTEQRLKDLQERLKRDAKKTGRAGDIDRGASPIPLEPRLRFGTVGAVARDRRGNLAAGTSTGGLTAKRHGRVGDSPIIGAGTFADNKSCAISATGDGEYFIRAVAAHDIAALVEYKGMTVKHAAEEVLFRKIKPTGGDGAVIVLDPKGNLAMPYTTDGLYRGYMTDTGQRKVMIYDE